MQKIMQHRYFEPKTVHAVIRAACLAYACWVVCSAGVSIVFSSICVTRTFLSLVILCLVDYEYDLVIRYVSSHPLGQ
jgi:hypothetical protein